MPADLTEPAEAAAGAPPAPSPQPRRRGARRRRVAGGRPHDITVSLSDDELAAVSERASAAGLSVGAYLASAAEPRVGLGVAGMSVEERRAWASELMSVRRLLAATGNNVNQLARAANSGTHVDSGVARAAISACDRAAARAGEVLDRLHGGRGAVARPAGGPPAAARR